MSVPSMPPPLPSARPAPRSMFVNVMAWLSLALGLLGVISGLLQAAVFASLDLGNQLAAGLEQGGAQALLPPQLLWVFQHLQLINGLSTLAALVTTVVSWGLWQRREWGRVGFIALLLLSAALGIAFSVWMAGVMDTLLKQAAGDPALVDPMVGQMLAMYKTTLYVGSLVIALLHGGLAWKLHTPEIRAEFEPA